MTDNAKFALFMAALMVLEGLIVIGGVDLIKCAGLFCQ